MCERFYFLGLCLTKLGFFGFCFRRRRKSKKRISRQAPGISSIALQEAQDIFGDVDELLSRRKQGLKARGFDGLGVLDDDQGARRLEDEFEPSILAEKYMTAKDDEIRETDVPERFQVGKICILLMINFVFCITILLSMFGNLNVK